jgi:hypothetical protein
MGSGMIDDPAAGTAGMSCRPSSLYRTMLAIALLAAASPILIFPIPPLFDYPAHLARQFIIHDLLTKGSFSAMYELHIAVIPNLGMESVVLPLLFLGVPVELAGRIFLVLIVALLGTSVVRVHRALFRKTSLFPLFSLAFIFNPVFMFGFANYLFGFALALHAFAWWLHARQKPAMAILPVLLVWAIALFFCHLMATAFFFGLVGAYEVSRSATLEGGFSHLCRVVALLAGPLLAVALLYRLAPLSTAPQAIEVHSIGEMLARIPTRLRALPLYLTAYSRPLDAIILFALAAILGLAAWFRRLRVSWPMLLPILGLVALYALVPETWAGTDYISYRIPIAALFLFFGSIDIEWDGRYLPAMAVAGALGLRTASVLIAWAQANAQYRPMLQALTELPAHSSIYTGVNYRGSSEPLVRMPWSHFDAYAAIRNGAFVRGIWADPTQNWIVLTPRYAKLTAIPLSANRLDRPPRKDSDMFGPALIANYDFLLAVQPELYEKPIPAGVRIMAQSGQATLFSLHGR